MKILYHKRFIKRTRKCTKADRELLAKKIELFCINPFDISFRNHQLHGKYIGHKSIDIKGNLLALYVEIDKETIEFRYLGTHHELYGS